MSKELKQSSYFIKIGFDSCYNQMKKKLDEKDKEIARLKRALHNLKDDVIRRRMFATTVEEKMFLDETRCHLEAELDFPTDNNVGSMEETNE